MNPTDFFWPDFLLGVFIGASSMLTMILLVVWWRDRRALTYEQFERRMADRDIELSRKINGD